MKYTGLFPFLAPTILPFSFPSEDREGSFWVTLSFFFPEFSQQATNILLKSNLQLFFQKDKNHTQDLDTTQTIKTIHFS